MAWAHQQSPQQIRPRANNGYSHQPPQAQQPIKLRRQASELKSMYPLTKWCAVYVNTQSNAASLDWNDDSLDVITPIPSTNVYVPMDLEENIIAEIEMYIDEDKELMDSVNKQKLEVEESKKKEETDKNEKIDTFMTFTSMTDRNKAKKLLEENDWDLQKAAAAQFSSSPDINSSEGGGDDAHQLNGNGGSKAVIRMILPDNRQYTYQMDGNDTFWGVYGRLLQSVPELNQKEFSLELSNGHVLNENEFDQTLSETHLIPRGDIRVKY